MGFGLFACDVGLVANHDDCLFGGASLDDFALLVRAAHHEILLGRKGRDGDAKDYADSDDDFSMIISYDCYFWGMPTQRSPMAPVMVVTEAAESKEDARRAVVPIAITVMAVTVAAPPPPVAMPTTPMDGIDLAGIVFADAA